MEQVFKDVKALPAKLAYSQIGSCACQNYTIKHGSSKSRFFVFLSAD
jgi:hypothetical protein